MSTTVLPYSLSAAVKVLREQGPAAPAVLPEAFFANVADALDEAAAAPSGSELERMGESVHMVLEHCFRSLPAETRRDVLAAEQGGLAFRVYQLGQLAFAQLFASQHGHKRADQAFFDLLRKTSVLPFIRALHEAERSNHELSVMLRYSEEHVSRSLKQLRNAGITDFRKDGRSVINFLTPPARIVFEQQRQEELAQAGRASGKRAGVFMAVHTPAPAGVHAATGGQRYSCREVAAVYSDTGILSELEADLPAHMRHLAVFGDEPATGMSR